MGATYDDLEGHEGYVEHRRPPGPGEVGDARPYVAACSCGWTGGAHPAGEEGHETALEEWDAGHARPLLARAVPGPVAAMSQELRAALVELGRERPQAARVALRELVAWALALQAERAALDGPRRDGRGRHPDRPLRW